MRKKFALIALASLVLSGCGDTINGKSVAEPQVAVFHGRLNAKQFDEIYTTAGADFRKSGGKDKKINLFAAINRKLGAAKSSNLVSWNVMTDNFKTKAVVGRRNRVRAWQRGGDIHLQRCWRKCGVGRLQHQLNRHDDEVMKPAEHTE